MEDLLMKNLSDTSNLNKSLKIESVTLNQDDTTVDVKVIGLGGDKYNIKVSEKETAYNFENKEITYYSPTPIAFNIELVKGRSYEFSLFDSHNTILDVFTFKSPKDFKHLKQEIKVEEPVVLEKTSDIYFNPLLFISYLIILFSLSIKIKRKGRY